MHEDIHPRRMNLEYSVCTPDNLEQVPEKGKDDIGRFEYKYGFPTNIDKVWEDREKWMNRNV